MSHHSGCSLNDIPLAFLAQYTPPADTWPKKTKLKVTNNISQTALGVPDKRAKVPEQNHQSYAHPSACVSIYIKMTPACPDLFYSLTVDAGMIS